MDYYLRYVERVTPQSLEKILEKSECGLYTLASLHTVVHLVDAPDQSVELITCLERYYSLIYRHHPRRDEWQRDQERKHARQFEISKTEKQRLLRCYKQLQELPQHFVLALQWPC